MLSGGGENCPVSLLTTEGIFAYLHDCDMGGRIWDPQISDAERLPGPGPPSGPLTTVMDTSLFPALC